MKRININIKIDDLGKDIEGVKNSKLTGSEVTIKFVEMGFTDLMKTPRDPKNPASMGLQLPEQRKIGKIFDALEAHKKGMVDLEDDLYEYLKTSFNKVKWTGGTRIVVRVADAIEKVLDPEVNNP